MRAVQAITAVFALLICVPAQRCLAADDRLVRSAHEVHPATAEASVVKVDREVERLEGRLRSRISLWEQSPAHIRESLALFEQDRVAYRTYRQAQCALRASSASTADVSAVRTACEAALDRDRTAIIQATIVGFDPGD